MNLEETSKQFQAALNCNNVPLIKKILAENVELVTENALEILPLITATITKELESNNTELFNSYCNLLDHFCEKCYVDDIVLALHKEVIGTNDHIQFVHLLDPLKVALLKLPLAKTKYFVWCFNALQVFMNDVKVPRVAQIESNEGVNEIPVDIIKQLELLYSKIAEFYFEIVEYLKSSNVCLEKMAFRNLINLFGTSMIYLSGFNLAILRNSLEELTAVLISSEDPHKYLIEHFCYEAQMENIQVNNVAVGHLFYLLFVEKLCLEMVPKVYSSQFIFQKLLKFINSMLKVGDLCLTEKALLLAKEVIKSKNLHYTLLDEPVHAKFSLTLSNVIIYNGEKTIRLQALEVLKAYIWSFDNKGRCLLIINIFNRCNHSGLMGYLITLYKDLLVEQYKNDLDVEEIFKGRELVCAIKNFCFFPEWKFSSLVKHADHLISALNLLIFLVIRDESNVIGIKGLISGLVENLIMALQKSLTESKDECILTMKEMEGKVAQGDLKETKLKVTVAGEDLPDASAAQKLNILRTSLNTLNLIECVLFRLTNALEK